MGGEAGILNFGFKDTFVGVRLAEISGGIDNNAVLDDGDNVVLPVFGSGGKDDLIKKKVGWVGISGKRGKDGVEGVDVAKIAAGFDRVGRGAGKG